MSERYPSVYSCLADIKLLDFDTADREGICAVNDIKTMLFVTPRPTEDTPTVSDCVQPAFKVVDDL